MTGVERLRELERQATPGPWEYGVNHWAVPAPAVLVVKDGRPSLVAEMGIIEGLSASANADLIAEARNALPLLLDIAESAKRLTDCSVEQLDGKVIVYQDDLADLKALLAAFNDTEGT